MRRVICLNAVLLLAMLIIPTANSFAGLKYNHFARSFPMNVDGLGARRSPFLKRTVGEVHRARETDDFNEAKSTTDFKVNSQIARLNALAAKLRSEAAALEAEQKQAAADTLAKAFATFDSNNDGEISLEELKEGLAIALYSSISEEQATKLMRNFDKNGDGRLQLDEFQGIDAFRTRLDKLLRDEKQSAAEARLEARAAKAAAEQAEAIAELINNQPPTLSDKFASVLPFLLPLLDSLPYGANVFKNLNVEGNPALSLLALLYNIYDTIPFSGLIAFYFFNVLSTNLRLNRLVRFNIQQAIYLDIALIIPGLIGPLIAVAAKTFGLPISAEVSSLCSTVTFIAFIATILYSVLSSLLGVEPDKVPYISQQVKKRVPTTEEFKSMFDDEGNFKPIQRQLQERKSGSSKQKDNQPEGDNDDDDHDDDDGGGGGGGNNNNNNRSSGKPRNGKGSTDGEAGKRTNDKSSEK